MTTKPTKLKEGLYVLRESNFGEVGCQGCVFADRSGAYESCSIEDFTDDALTINGCLSKEHPNYVWKKVVES